MKELFLKGSSNPEKRDESKVLYWNYTSNFIKGMPDCRIFDLNEQKKNFSIVLVKLFHLTVVIQLYHQQ